jgi:hypothetical protein
VGGAYVDEDLNALAEDGSHQEHSTSSLYP